jgi:hypothetical protein
MWVDFIPSPLLPWDCQIAIRIGDRSIDIMQLTLEPHLAVEFTGSRRKPILEITAYTVELPAITQGLQHDLQESEYTEPQLVLALDNDTEVAINPYWDKPPLQVVSIESPLFALVLAHHLSVKAFTAHPPPKVLVLEIHGDHYERIGLFPKHMLKKSPRVDFRNRGRPSVVGHSEEETLSDTHLWLRYATKRTILLA